MHRKWLARGDVKAFAMQNRLPKYEPAIATNIGALAISGALFASQADVQRMHAQVAALRDVKFVRLTGPKRMFRNLHERWADASRNQEFADEEINQITAGRCKRQNEEIESPIVLPA